MPVKQASAPRPQGKRKAVAEPDPAPPSGLKRGTTAVDLRIYRAVVQAVMSHRLPPGTHLGEADFCELYQVSRTTVRKALQRLAHDHIIELRPNRGAAIARTRDRAAGDTQSDAGLAAADPPRAGGGGPGAAQRRPRQLDTTGRPVPPAAGRPGRKPRAAALHGGAGVALLADHRAV